MKKQRYAAVILAAGRSSRMHDFKPLIRLGGETITDRVISIFRANDTEVFLVTGWRHDELVSGIEHRDIRIVQNPDYDTGMFSSIKAGVSQLGNLYAGFFIMPVDIPLVRPATIRHLLKMAADHTGNIIYPAFTGKHGHPTLLPSFLIPRIMAWQKEGGLKALLDLHRPVHLDVPVVDANILLDVDSPEDLIALNERFGKYDIPTPVECNAMLDIAGTAQNVRRHCRKVAEVAVIIAEALVKAGHPVDIEAVRAAAILHDIAKVSPEHDIAGGKLIRDYGFTRIGDIIEAHTGFSYSKEMSIETKLVLLTDKFVRDEEIISIEERYATAARKYASVPDIGEKIQRGQAVALEVKKEIEAMVGSSLDGLIQR